MLLFIVIPVSDISLWLEFYVCKTDVKYIPIIFSILYLMCLWRTQSAMKWNDTITLCLTGICNLLSVNIHTQIITKYHWPWPLSWTQQETPCSYGPYQTGWTGQEGEGFSGGRGCSAQPWGHSSGSPPDSAGRPALRKSDHHLLCDLECKPIINVNVYRGICELVVTMWFSCLSPY